MYATEKAVQDLMRDLLQRVEGKAAAHRLAIDTLCHMLSQEPNKNYRGSLANALDILSQSAALSVEGEGDFQSLVAEELAALRDDLRVPSD